MQNTTSQKKSIIIEFIILVIVLGGLYYGYTVFSESSPATGTQGVAALNQQLLGQNFVLFLKAVNQNSFSLNDTSFLNLPLVQQLKDYSQIISPNDTRGRVDPFLPYATSRSIR